MMMAGILEYYMETFIPSIEGVTETEIDISSLIEFASRCSPVIVDYLGDKDNLLREMSTAIIVNFCKNYAQSKTFIKEGIESMTAVISKSIDENVVAQRMLLLHLTKIKWSANLATFYYTQVNGMIVKPIMLEYEIQWQQLAFKVIQHKQIQSIIDESVAEFNIPISTETNDIKVTLVENMTSTLRGFSGRDEIFINTDHFREKIDGFKGDLLLLQILAKIDIISVVLHEFAHVKIRKCSRNVNMSTPSLAQSQKLDLNHYEFGAYNEKRIFNMQVDWFLSSKSSDLDVNYIERFITAIEKGELLPTGFIAGAVERLVSPGFGVDIHRQYYIE